MHSDDRAFIETLLRDHSAPEWARPVLIRFVGEFSGENADCVLEDQVIDASYLEFLREQIELEARGPEWTSLLSSRLLAFEPLLGQRLRRIEVRREGAMMLGYLLPATGVVVHIEVHRA